jgi:hypothetical protein
MLRETTEVGTTNSPKVTTFSNATGLAFLI